MNLYLKRLERRFDLRRYLEQYEYKEVSNNAVMTCPQCDKEDKLYILLEDKHDTDGELVRRGNWICYYCNDNDAGGAGRTCMSLIEWLEDVEWLEAIRRLAEEGSSGNADFIGAMEKAFAELEQDSTEDKIDEIPEVKLPQGFQMVDDRHYPAYVAERGISVTRAMRFRLGYCETGHYANRLIAPVYFARRLVGFQARYMQKRPPIDKATGKRIKKTMHAKGAKLSRVIYNWDTAKHQKRIVLVESPWAGIRIGRQGAATFGKHLSAAQLELLLKSEAEEVVFMWDRDADHAPGKGGYDKSIAFAQKIAPLVKVRAVKMPDGRDPDEMSLARIEKLIAKTPVISASDAWIERTARWMDEF